VCVASVSIVIGAIGGTAIGYIIEALTAPKAKEIEVTAKS
jgi:phage shock protein PspC (stress-responsive transcriptional regulator)